MNLFLTLLISITQIIGEQCSFLNQYYTNLTIDYDCEATNGNVIVIGNYFSIQTLTMVGTSTIYTTFNFHVMGNSTFIMKDNTNVTVVPNLFIFGNSTNIFEGNSLIQTFAYFDIYNNATVIARGNSNVSTTKNSLLILRETSKLYLLENATVFSEKDIEFYNNSQIFLVGYSNTIAQHRLNVYANATLTMKENSKLDVGENIELSGNSVNEIGGNAFIICKGILNVNGSVSLTLKEDSIINVGKNTLMKENIVFSVTDNAFFVSEEGVLLGDKSKTVINENSKLVLKNGLDLNGDTFFSMYGNSQLNVQNEFLISRGATFDINENAKLKTMILSVTEYGNLKHKNSNITPQINYIESQNMNCFSGIIDVQSHLYFNISNSLNLNDCDMNIYFRTIRDTPLFFTKMVDLLSGSYGFSNVDLIYSEIPFTGSTPIGAIKLLNDKLLRFGNSKKIFCHVKNTINNLMEFVESYCPCDSSEDWYITPLNNVTILLIQPSSIKTEKNTFKSEDEFSNESVTIGNQQISLYNTDNFVLGISTNDILSLQITSLTKTVLFISETNLALKGVQFKAAINTQNTTKIIYGRSCVNIYYDKTTQSCINCTDANCIKCSSNKNVCEQCDFHYLFKDGICVEISNCLLIKSNRCLKCMNGFYIRNGVCEPIEKCIVYDRDGKCGICNILSNCINREGECIEVDKHSILFDNSKILSCQRGYFLDGDKCILCEEKYEKSEFCELNRITKCNSISLINLLGSCETNNCNNPNDENGKCLLAISNCTFQTNTKCVECESGFVLSNHTCYSQVDDNCVQNNKMGCQRCIDLLYFDKQTESCEHCDDNCRTCLLNSTFCLSCPEGTFLSNHKCVTNEDLNGICTQFVQSGGCVKCIDGYYREGLNCFKCNEKCSTCLNKDTCLTCNLTNYKTNNGECKPQSSINGCSVEVTQNGCSKCQSGYFIKNSNECEKCDNNCKTCVLNNKQCISCEPFQVLLLNNTCVGLSQVSNCHEITNSKCSKCSFWNVPSGDGISCESQIVWWVILIAVVFFCILLILSVVFLIVFTKKILGKIHTKSVEKTTTLFKMNNSNIKFEALQNGICVSSKEICFNYESTEIPVEQESREMFCVGNTNKNVIKIQFTISVNSDKFTIKIDPEVVSLKRGYACEFSIYLTPHCTCQIDNSLQIVSKNFKNGDEKYNTISLHGTTQQSTRIDYDELVEENKLGEGSFGIVYKGTYRKHIVAIKKMKNIMDDNAIDEFINEVSMLDKFRSEYIVHFYGAVFIPNKVCMVTEFAQFGSLQDLMEHKKSGEIDVILRVKMMLDASKGISYLHNNGILHRDIKPDNILVVSLDLNSNVNAKLTDFGSSRNVNMLMTNMTFTKGIGTPKYMAPEILKQQKYTKSADIYSFGITLYEVFGWCEAYQQKKFKFPWKIAEFVIKGNHLKIIEQITEEQYTLIEMCWRYDENNRISSFQIEDCLEKMMQSLNYTNN
ncbi:protein serine/threonine kinase, putative [Entamoeba invadens IP1]|uniref:Protein serine/threonine kinase, putative n=1 Tax=Entamoeba invadens IP1 TaxID=370355 RepID=L7FK90_ENTIV|nr:protein serine/threonine kinase, putative [Entamoeba invadens IP1]ELP84035.1 protein serine/threonine kinase, putative [Entamoeba invadens IP1]|eukprot:XP_004183381.1 protein serine/threonine kinase, putative [Entamoeba invadens IP1]